MKSSLAAAAMLLMGVATVQVRTDDDECFSATLTEVKKNDADQFKAKLKN